MDIVAILNTIISSQESAYFAGIIAAFTPCTLSMIPIFLYRFGVWGKKKQSTKKISLELGLVILGFMSSFMITGFVFQELASSDFVNVTRLILGTILVLVGLLQLSGKVSFQFITNVTNPLALGAVLPWIISFSPCVLPFLSAIIVGGTLSGGAIGTFFLFGLGILTPAILLSFVGNRAMNTLRKYSKAIASIERWSAFLIILSGIYLSSQLLQITDRDILIAAFILFLQIALVAYIILKHKKKRTIRNYTLIFLTIIFWLISSIYLNSIAADYETTAVSGQDLALVCIKTENDMLSPVSIQTASLFNAIPVMLAGTYLISPRKGRVIVFKTRD